MNEYIKLFKEALSDDIYLKIGNEEIHVNNPAAGFSFVDGKSGSNPQKGHWYLYLENGELLIRGVDSSGKISIIKRNLKNNDIIEMPDGKTEYKLIIKSSKKSESINKITKENTMSLEYKKLYVEKTLQEESLTDCLVKLAGSMEINKDPYFFGRAVGNSIEDAINSLVKTMEKSKVDSSEREAFVNNFIDMLIKTVKSTKDLHKNRNGG